MKTGGIEELSISGGEPFLHPDLFSMVKYARSLDIRTVIFTSGVVYRKPLSASEIDYYTEKKSRDIAEVLECEPWNQRLVKSLERHYDNFIHPSTFSGITKDDLLFLKEIGLEKIVFDYQGYEAETDSYLMGRCESMRRALLDSLFNASVVGLNVDVHFVPMKVNYKEILDILELLEIVKVRNISLLNFVPQGRGLLNKDILSMNEEEKVEFFKLLECADSYYSGNIRRGIPLQGERTHKCNAGLSKLVIKYDGTVLPCPAFKELSQEEARKYGIKLWNIYGNLEEVFIPGFGSRSEPLCEKVYKCKVK